MSQMQHSLDSNVHLKMIENWQNINIKDISLKTQVELFIKAIKAVEARTLKTLSSVTLMVILDRVLYQSKEKFPLLSAVTIEPKGMNFDGLISKNNNHELPEILNSLRYLLVELLRVLGSITADILTEPLYKEIQKVTLIKSAQEHQ